MALAIRLKILQIFLVVAAAFVLFWWPLSHWFYPEWYHVLMGFEHPARYSNNALVVTIGLEGFLPVLVMFFAAANPLRNRDIIKALIVFGLLGCGVVIYLVRTEIFPSKEYLNALLYGMTSICLLLLYPWHSSEE
jgi:hypothetical protein